MRYLSFIVYTAILALGSQTEAAEDLDALSKSPVWQVRYCVPRKFDAPSADARRVLERLAVDEAPSVSQQAFSAYARMFVVLDRAIVEKAFKRGDFDMVGIEVNDRNVFKTPEFWIDRCNDTTGAPRAQAVRALGMCGSAADAKKLAQYLETSNPYLLIELAIAFHRLGDERRYLEAIEAILALPLMDALFYQTYAIDCLIQTHPDRARPAWNRVHEQFERSKDCQPGWVYSHIVQEARIAP